MSALEARLSELGLSRPAFFVPGRIEVLGKHTDYAGGRSVLCAISRGIVASVAPRRDSLVRVTDMGRRETREVPLAPEIETPPGDWSNYVATVARRVARNFPDARRGADITFASDLPAASGMSSSSSLTVALFLALDAVNGLRQVEAYREIFHSPEALAAYLASVEMGSSFGALEGDRGVGTFGGSEDHTAILCCRAGFLSRYAFAPTRSEGSIPFPPNSTFVIAFSGVTAEKTGRAMALYNELSLSTRRIVEAWNAATGRSDGTLGAVIENGGGTQATDRIRRMLIDGAGAGADRLRDRFDQFVLESEDIIPRACEAFSIGDLATFGDLVHASQLAAEVLLGNQIAETRALVRLARAEGAAAASAFGAGFGGSVWALVNTSDAEHFTREWRAAYAKAFPDRAHAAEFFATRPGPGATRI